MNLQFTDVGILNGLLYKSYRFQLLCNGLPLLPSFVEAEERCGSIHPLDESRSRPEWGHRVMSCLVQLLIIPVL